MSAHPSLDRSRRQVLADLGYLGLAGGLAGCGGGGSSSPVTTPIAVVPGPTPTPTPSTSATPAPRPMTETVSFEGSWYAVSEGAIAAMSTIRGGDYLRFGLTGSAGVVLGYLDFGSATPPVLDLFVDGVRTGSAIGLPAGKGAGYQELTVPIGAASAVRSIVELRIRGLHEHDDKWVGGAGLAVVQVRAITAGGIVDAAPDSRPAILGIGDSTLETIRARGDYSAPLTSAGDASWLRIAGDVLGFKPIHNGFGGTGLLVTGSGNLPALYDASINVNPFASSNARLYKNGIARAFAANDVRAVVIATGFNDAILGAPAAVWRQSMASFLQQALGDYPAVRTVTLLPSFARQSYRSEMITAVQSLADSRVAVMDTAGLGLVFSDGAHPTLADQVVIGAAVAAHIRGR